MTEFVYMNFNSYKVVIHLSNGLPLIVTQNNGVKGKFFAKHAAPNGPLTPVEASKVMKSAIIFTVADVAEQPAAVVIPEVKSTPVVAPVVVPETYPVVVEEPIAEVESEVEPTEEAEAETPLEEAPPIDEEITPVPEQKLSFKPKGKKFKK